MSNAPKSLEQLVDDLSPLDTTGVLDRFTAGRWVNGFDLTGALRLIAQEHPDRAGEVETATMRAQMRPSLWD